ncbi:MAG: beta-ketoacyl-[acyl-carrier-protein] synthase II [Omnitrophica WOR_2 bacterium RIFOXYB2_FULL_38_16]|nr:MAG: beta-ketoacyl-[acyl-carrier-protein] synthase II [Omnitrophica WOR_2 bacterium RIFOXYA12_FULL_38_10]OGX55896.1 MAG: beta-ketoacyl-[acyl-carrier-protein] synthase II [Omnitrophica WOR_2 bacterium RIFOXYC2_FULL_38_12]OGX58237.1 MAG: beta-ketoacyl-[acyl-carrier-protein] synthase II [Omnitrophica WOR_2 bacterium RIFOXYB2_FULL_38_16]
MDKRRVVITGIGVLSPVGCGTEKFWQALIAGKSGIDVIKTFDASDFSTRIAGELKDYDPLEHFSTKDARNLANFVQYASVATKEAIANAKLDLSSVDLDRVAVLVGSGIGSIRTAEEEYQKYLDKGPKKISPHFIPKIIINEAAGQVSIDTGARGFASCVTTACSTATNAIGDAFRFIQYGDADVIIAGGTESATTILGVGGFSSLKALSQRNEEPQKASRPFDLNRDGFVMAEGAGIVILESLEHAKKRGAPIIAEMAGYGRTSDAYHITAPESSGAGAAKAMELAIKDAGLTIKDISYINAHGTSTKLNDKVESLAIKTLFKEHAMNVPVSSTKSMTGHLLGAAGGIEFAACLLAIRDNIIPPTINYETPDPDCDLDYVPNVARKVTVKVAMSNSLGFGGHNATIIAKAYQE